MHWPVRRHRRGVDRHNGIGHLHAATATIHTMIKCGANVIISIASLIILNGVWTSMVMLIYFSARVVSVCVTQRCPACLSLCWS